MINHTWGRRNIGTDSADLSGRLSRQVLPCLVKRSIRLSILLGMVLGAGDARGVLVAQDRPTAALEKHSDKLCFVVRQLTDPTNCKVQVRRADSDQSSRPSMLGSSFVKDGILVFQPRFPVQKGATYMIEVESETKATPLRFKIAVPGGELPPAKVERIYPTSDRLPENLLKFYVQFSTPMQKGDIYRFVQLREQDAEVVELPFLEIEQEFWSRDSKRLTLLLDPGRIKRGLKPREEMGPILVAGKTYELVIDGRWPDARGNPLGEDFVKTFSAITEDRIQPDPNAWNLSKPMAGERSALSIQFPAPLDQAMLNRSIVLLDSEGRPLRGKVVVSRNEQLWSFEPELAWQVGRYRLSIDANLEDNSGNSIGRPFDVDLFDKTEPSDSLPAVELTFEISR